MTRAKVKIKLPLDGYASEFLTVLAKKEGKTLTSKALDLLNFALEYQEDMILGQMAVDAVRENNNKPTISHEELCKRLLQRPKKRTGKSAKNHLQR